MLPKFRKKTDNIFLTVLFKEKYIKQFGLNNILSPLIQDLMDLESIGISVVINNTEKIVKGSLIAVLADNLGSHQIGGFCENFSTSQYVCRYCYIESKCFKKSDSIHPVAELRNPTNYKADLEELLSNNEFNNVRGIKTKSCLNKLKYYNICNPGLPPCIAHDLFEGFAKRDLKYIIDYYINSRIISLNFLNSSLKILSRKLKLNVSFPIIKETKKLPGKAHEIWMIIILFPLIMLPKNISTSTNVWKMFVALLKIVRIVCADEITFDQISFLEMLISEYFYYRHLCFEKQSITPKQHYLSHYPFLIKQFGPLINVWTMHCERKHHTLKSIYKKAQNSINITKTICETHQLYQSTLQYCRFPEAITCRISSFVHPGMFDTNQFQYICENITIHDVTYKKDEYVVIGVEENFNIKLLQIRYIFSKTNYEDPTFYGTTCEMFYNYRNGLYELIKKSSLHEYAPHANLKFRYSVLLYTLKNSTYLSLPSSVYNGRQ